MLHSADPSARLLIVDYDGKVLHSLQWRDGQYVLVQEPQAPRWDPTPLVPVPASFPPELTPAAVFPSTAAQEPTVTPVSDETAEQTSDLAPAVAMAAASTSPLLAAVVSAIAEQQRTPTAAITGAFPPVPAQASPEAILFDERQSTTLYTILLELQRVVEDIEEAVIVTLDGRVLSALSAAQGASLGAMTAAMQQLATHADRLLDGGGLKQLLMRHATITLMIYPIAEVATLGVLLAARGNIRMLQSTCRDTIEKIVEALRC
jgi:predicted regulator of Ras-like GTPase activity (Roadblock/LC7/MglB family)